MSRPERHVPVRVPVFVEAQSACETCGREIRDASVIEAWGRFCSARCVHAHGLPRVRRQGA